MKLKTAGRLKLTIQIVFGLLFLLAGKSRLWDAELFQPEFERWGYALWFIYVVGFVEFTGGLALIIPRTSRWASFALLVIMVGAFGTHVLAGEWSRLISVAIFSSALISILMLDRKIRQEVDQQES